MAAKRRARDRSRTRVDARPSPPPSTALAPPAIVAGPSGAYVRLPLPPDLLEALAEHVDNGRRLYDLFTRADASVEELTATCRAAAAAIARDVAKLQRVRARTRGR